MAESERVQHVAGKAVACAILSMILHSPVSAQPPTAGDPLAALDFKKEKLGWDGLYLGMSLVQAERKIGTTLAIDSGPGGECTKFVAVAERHGLRLTLGFPSPKPGARVQWIQVRFEGAQVLAAGPDLAVSLRAKQPGATWIQPDSPAGLLEEEDLSPAYSIPAKQPQVVRFEPRESMILAFASCDG
jgi:hypothetical protein